MKKLIITIAITLLSIPTAFGQNIELIATVYGYYEGFREVAGNSQNAFIATQGTTGMLILDISDPFNPFPVGLLEDTGQLHGGLALSRDFVYLCNFTFPGGTMSVIDVSDPENPQLLGSCQTQTLIGETFYYEGFCYLTCDYTVEIVDVSNPQFPVIVSTIDPPGDWPRSTVVYNDLAYITSYTGMTIYDISDPSHPVQLGFFPAPDVYCIDVSGDYAVIETYVEDSLLVIDVSDPTDPLQVGSFYLGEEEVCEQLRANGEYVYVSRVNYGPSFYDNGVIILNISDPSHPVDVGNFGEEFSYLYFYDNYLYTRSGNKGFIIYEISDPVEPQEMGIYNRLSPHETILKDDFAFVLNNYAGIQVLDISNIYSPFEVEFYYSPGKAKDFAMSGDYIYLADDEAGLRIIDISDPYNLTEAGSYYYPSIEYECIEIYDDLVITTGDRSLVILDAANPDSVMEVNSITLQEGNPHWELELMGDFAVLAISDSIVVLDISDPLHLNMVGSCQISITQNGLEVEDSYAYVNDFSPGGLSIINLEDPANPYEEYYIFKDIMLEDVEVVGDYCYLALYWGVFEIYDISHPSNPIQIGSYSTPSGGRAVTVYDSIVYFGASLHFLIFDCSDYVSVEKTAESGNPATFELFPPHPNPFNQSTVISFEMRDASFVSLEIFDVTGRSVGVQNFEPLHKWMPAGSHRVIFDANELTSGVYFARLIAGDSQQTQKLLLIK